MRNPMSLLPAFALPFVGRALRRSRLRLFVGSSLVLALLTVAFALFAAFDPGRSARELRVNLGFESSIHHNERERHIVYSHDPAEHLRLSQQRQEALRNPMTLNRYGSLGNLTRDALVTLKSAADAATPPRSHLALQGEAQALLSPTWRAVIARNEWRAGPYENEFSWSSPEEVKRLKRIVERGPLPVVQRYRSPLGVGAAVDLLGFVSGAVLCGLFFILWPVLVVAQVAQEVHENTLAPLRGSALNASQLALGLLSAPLAICLITASPQLFFFAVAAGLSMQFGPALGLLTIVAVGSSLAALLGALLAHSAARRRMAPASITAAMVALFSVSLPITVAAAWGVVQERELTDFGLLLPPAAALANLFEGFWGPLNREGLLSGASSDGAELWKLRLLSPLSWIPLLVITHRGLTRILADHEGARLTRAEAAVGFVSALVMTLYALPDDAIVHGQRSDFAPIYFLSLAPLALLWASLIAARVPWTDGPSSMRALPLRSLALEAGLAIALHGAAALLYTFWRSSTPGLPHPASVVWLAWGLTVLFLAVVRHAALERSVLGTLWVFLCIGASMISGVQAVIFSEKTSNLPAFFPFFEAGALAGTLQVGAFVLMPLLLLRRLKRASARVS